MKDILHYLATFFGVMPGELLGAVGGVLGGFVGALGAALAVFLTLRGQRKDEREKVSSALHREVMEFCRLALGHLETCDNIRAGKVSIFKSQFSSVMAMPKPIIYVAAADRIGLLHAPHRIVSFYARIAEIERLVQLIATEPVDVQPYVKDVTVIAHAWVDVCRLGRWFLEEKPVEPNLDAQATAHFIGEIDAAVKKVEETFPLSDVAPVSEGVSSTPSHWRAKMRMPLPVIVGTVAVALSLCLNLLGLVLGGELLRALVSATLAALLLIGFVRGHRLAWQWARYLAPVTGLVFLLAAVPMFGLGGVANMVDGALYLVLALVMFAFPFLLSRPQSVQYFHLVCPSCGARTAKAADFFFNNAKCQKCQRVW